MRPAKRPGCGSPDGGHSWGNSTKKWVKTSENTKNFQGCWKNLANKLLKIWFLRDFEPTGMITLMISNFRILGTWKMTRTDWMLVEGICPKMDNNGKVSSNLQPKRFEPVEVLLSCFWRSPRIRIGVCLIRPRRYSQRGVVEAFRAIAEEAEAMYFPSSWKDVNLRSS